MNTPVEDLPKISGVTDSTDTVKPESTKAAGELVKVDTKTVGNTDSPESAGTFEDSENPQKEEGAGDGGNAEETAAPAGATAEADDIKIEAAVEFINDAIEKSMFENAILIGRYILDKFYDGNIELATSKSPKKGTSYGDLCEREDLRLSRMQLSTMVRVASQEKFLTDKRVDVAQLKYTHKASLIKITNDEQKIQIAEECIQNGWSTRELDIKIASIIGPAMSEGGLLIRKTTSYIQAIDKVLNLDESVFDMDETKLSGLKEKQRKNLEKKLENLKAGVEESTKKSETIVNKCNILLNKLSGDRVIEQQGSEESAVTSEKSQE